MALFILANIGYGVSVVVYYSFLPEIATPDERDEVSSRGWAFGYLGGGVALALHLAFYLAATRSALSEDRAVRICFLTSGSGGRCSRWSRFATVPAPRQAPQGGERGLSRCYGGIQGAGGHAARRRRRSR